MIIHHVNSDSGYELYQANGNFFIKSGSYKAIHAKNDLHAAIWFLIDWIRMVCFTNITEQDCEKLCNLSGSTKRFDKEAIMNTICGRKINRVFYEQAYALIYEAYQNDYIEDIPLSNDVNFFIYEEILQLLRFNTVKINYKIGR